MARSDLAREFISNYKMWASTAVLLIAWYVWMAKKWSKEHFPLPPGPRGLPLVGFLPFLEEELHCQFEKLAKIYGPIMNVRLLNKNAIVVSSPELAREVMRDQDLIFANRNVTVVLMLLSDILIIFLPVILLFLYVTIRSLGFY
ncbi:carnosic acid synthase-like [Tasmannia lanceolata]|uniref:carnosic acid synthase-like n=1 Tax=Tasmannia lanceolata TaxID=3420 RepID=UPI00406470BA